MNVISSWPSRASIRPGSTTAAATIEVHVGIVLAQVDVAAIRSAGAAVVLDSVNGAGAAPGRTFAGSAWLRPSSISTASTRDASPAVPKPVPREHPELARRTADERAHVGFAQDPDADRLALVDEQGRCIGEEYTLVLAARRWLDLHGRADRHQPLHEPHDR